MCTVLILYPNTSNSHPHSHYTDYTRHCSTYLLIIIISFPSRRAKVAAYQTKYGVSAAYFYVMNVLKGMVHLDMGFDQVVCNPASAATTFNADHTSDRRYLIFLATRCLWLVALLVPGLRL